MLPGLAGIVGFGGSAAGGGGGGAASGALVHKSTGDQTVGTTFVTMNWNTENYDVGGWHDTVSNTSRMTVPSGVSLVRATGGLYASGPMLFQQRKNGAAFRGMGKSFSYVGFSAAVGTNAASAPIAVSASDYLEMQIKKRDTGSITPGDDSRFFFAIEALDPATKYALVYNSTSQALSAGVDTTLSWDSEVADTDAFHSAGTPTKLVVPSALNGKAVRLCANVTDAAVDTDIVGEFLAKILKNGSYTPGLPVCDSTGRFEENLNLFSAPLVVATGDEFTLMVNAASATSVPALEQVWFSIESVPDTMKRALVYMSSAQSISASTTTTLNYNTEVYDTDSIHDTSSNTSRMTVPAGCTKARACFFAEKSNTTGKIDAYVQKNGSDFYGMPFKSADTAGIDNVCAVGAWVDVTPGDYFEVKVFCAAACTVGGWFCLECQ